MSKMTERQRQLYNEALGRMREQEAQREATPTQRPRAFFQGLSFGTADEVEARAVSLATGRPYDEVLDEIRGKLKAYKEARPLEAMAFEVGGAALPALVPGGQSSLLRAAGRAAAEGAAYAFGTGEGGVEERLSRIPGGAVLGAGGGALGYGAAKAVGGLANKLTDAARRTIGGRGSTVVENEIQRLVKQTGKTADEITQDIIDGRLLAENRTIQAAVRALRSQGGDASAVIQRGLQGRPEQTRAAAMSELRRYLGDVGEGSQVAARRASEEATRAAEKEAYGALAGRAAPAEVLDALADTLRRVPSAAKEVEIRLQAQTGAKPFFEVAEDGTVSFTRMPTIDEAESIRRAVANRATSLYRAEGMGGAGEAVQEAEKGLRSILDYSIPELATTRAQAAAIRANRDAYVAGAKALAGDVNEKLADFAALQQGKNADEAVASFRAGLMQALEARAATGSRQSMIRNLANPETKEGMVLREVFPQDQLDSVIKRLDIASEAQAAQSGIMGGSQTAETMLEAGRQGMGIGADEIAGLMSGSPVETLNVAQKLIRRLVRTELTDAERTRIAKILVSNDPELVRRAIVDESGMQKLADTVNQLAIGLEKAGRAAGSTQAAQPGGEASQGIIEGLMGR